MARLVVLTEGLTGRSYELKAEKTTVGRVEDNSFQIAEGSISSHHCEILLRGNDVHVRDLGSTNGTYINDQKVAESPLRPGQILRVGHVEMRLEAGKKTDPETKPSDQTRVITRGVKAQDFEQGTKPTFEKSSPFAKKTNKAAMIFVIIGAVLGVIILLLLWFAFTRMT